MTESKPREWTLRIHSSNDGGGYIYSGDDVRYPQDDYLMVIEFSAYQAEREKVKELVDAIKEIRRLCVSDVHDIGGCNCSDGTKSFDSLCRQHKVIYLSDELIKKHGG